jgi:putative toxin-antitoxin system antitoxin component (TIGR02293 family)
MLMSSDDERAILSNDEVILSTAVEVMGGHAAAMQWMVNPVMGLDHQRPIDLMQTSEGAQLVSTFLNRLRFGVYC